MRPTYGAYGHTDADGLVTLTLMVESGVAGECTLLVKVYPDGVMSQQLAHLPIGKTVDFKHIPFNVRLVCGRGP